MITVELDPRLSAPPVKGVEYSDKEEVLFEYDEAETVYVNAGDLVDTPILDSDAYSLLPPSNIIVLSQTTRMTDTGQAVVDVLIEVVDDNTGVEYEVRMAV